MAAGGGGWTEIVKTLLDHGAVVSDKSDDGTTALILATGNHYTDVADLLRAKSAQ
jgi:ankyrin repeat protein